MLTITCLTPSLITVDYDEDMPRQQIEAYLTVLAQLGYADPIWTYNDAIWMHPKGLYFAPDQLEIIKQCILYLSISQGIGSPRPPLLSAFECNTFPQNWLVCTIEPVIELWRGKS